MNIHDIAKLAGVSVSTVSKVMNGKDKDISEKTKQRVLKVIEEEQYIPYLKFREKEGLKSHLIGLVLKKDNREGERIIHSAQKAAAEKGYGLLVQFAESLEEMQECVNDMQKKKVAGLILDSEKLVNTRKLEDATVYLCQTKEFDERQKATFYYRLSEAGRLAAERLMREGHEKIACVTLKKDRTIQDGYRLAMREANLAVQPLWSYEGKCLEDIEKYGIQQCLGEKVSAVICGSPEIAGCFQGVPGNDVGSRTDVLDGCPKGEGMMMLLRSMAPKVMAVDELGSREDVNALEQVLKCGCSVLATIHGASYEELCRKRFLQPLLEGHVFGRFLVLGRRDGKFAVEQIRDAEGRILAEGL